MQASQGWSSGSACLTPIIILCGMPLVCLHQLELRLLLLWLDQAAKH